MTIDTKTTAGGAVVLLLSGTGGYVATNAIKGGENKPTLKVEEEQGENSTPTKKDTKTGQGATETTGPKTQKADVVSETIQEEMTKAKFGEVASQEATCTETLKKPYKEADFKASVLACFKTKTLRERATQLNIQLIENESTKATLFQERTTSIGNTDLLKIANDTVAQGIQTGAGTTVITNTLPDFCKKVGDLTWQKANRESYSIEKEWEAYLKGCAKETSLTTNFWTGQ